jgi:hypothetical protein
MPHSIWRITLAQAEYGLRWKGNVINNHYRDGPSQKEAKEALAIFLICDRPDVPASINSSIRIVAIVEFVLRAQMVLRERFPVRFQDFRRIGIPVSRSKHPSAPLAGSVLWGATGFGQMDWRDSTQETTDLLPTFTDMAIPRPHVGEGKARPLSPASRPS